MAKKLNIYWLLAAIVFACAMTTGAATFAKNPSKKPSSAAIESLRQSAKKAIDNGNYETALRLYRKLAEKGDARGQYEAGVMVQGDHPKEALKWWRLAAAQGYAKAEYKLGTAYEHGYGVPKDRKAAIKWYKLAATHGSAEAEYKLGIKKRPPPIVIDVIPKPQPLSPSDLREQAVDSLNQCISDANHTYHVRWNAACWRIHQQEIHDYVNCMNEHPSTSMYTDDPWGCGNIYKRKTAAEDCLLPVSLADSLQNEKEYAKSDCFKKYQLGLH